MAEFDVAIVGFGPVGAVAACLFGQAGLKTLVIDKARAIYDKPRAVALDHEIARILQGIGLADALSECAEPFTDSVYLGVDGQVIKRLTMLPEPHPQAWTPSMVFMQPRLEQAIRARARSFPHVDIRLGQSLEGLAQDGNGVRLELSGPQGRASVAAQYLVGCDGASSFTRKALGLALDDLGFDEPWLVVDILATPEGLARLPQTSIQYCEPARPTSFIICTGNHRRWEISLNEGEDPREMEQPAQVWRLLERWISPGEATLWRSASYRFHALVARSWRQGRGFIAGDAAHQQPPFLGQGLCQGLRDIANLGWKLVRVIRGEAPESLLDSYGPERAGHVRRLTGTIRGIGDLIGERNVERAMSRDARLIAEAGGEVKAVPRQELMPALDQGCVSAQVRPGRGVLFPQPWIVTGEGRFRLDDRAGGGFRLFAVPGAPHISARVLAGLRALGGSFIQTGDYGEPGAAAWAEESAVVRNWFARHDAAFALVRPDHYVFGTVRDVAAASALIDEARLAAGSAKQG